jgi:hypothetical protein
MAGAEPTSWVKCLSYTKVREKPIWFFTEHRWIQQPHPSADSGFTLEPLYLTQEGASPVVGVKWQEVGASRHPAVSWDPNPLILRWVLTFSVWTSLFYLTVLFSNSQLLFYNHNNSRHWLRTSNVPGPIPGPLHVFICVILQPCYEIDIISILILQMRKPKY